MSNRSSKRSKNNNLLDLDSTNPFLMLQRYSSAQHNNYPIITSTPKRKHQTQEPKNDGVPFIVKGKVKPGVFRHFCRTRLKDLGSDHHNEETAYVGERASRENENEERSDDYRCNVASLLVGLRSALVV